MKVHIVAYEWASDQILARLIQPLLERAGYSVGTTPDPRADLQYFFPYITYAEKFIGWHETPTAAYFSHKDTSAAHKASWWEVAAQHIDFAIVTARQYGELLARTHHMPYALARPGLEPQFIPGQVRNEQPVVGVAGFVYGDGRKGEGLIERLAKSEVGRRITWKAAGKGWNVPGFQHYEWKDMHRFYQSLNVFVCASTIEGVPMPPLEAMACGVRCVIPRGVGMLDELPDLPDLYRFEAGDYHSLMAAVERAAFDRRVVDVNALRSVVRGYTVNNWVSDHQDAFENFLTPPLPVEILPDWKGKSGVFYVAYGEPARNCAVDAIASWKRHMPGIPAALVSDKPLGVEDVFIQHADTDVGARSVKTLIYDLAPAVWDYVLYLDADTEVIADVSFLFAALADGWELLICKNPDKYHTTRRMVRPDNKDECEATFNVMGIDDALQWNGGVFSFRRSPRTQTFFRAWHEEWNTWGKRDQAALLRAMWGNPLRVYTLGSEWNTITRYIDPDKSAGILHYPTTARRTEGMIPGRLDSKEAWQRVRK